MSPAYYFVT